MNPAFEFATAQRIVYGCGTVRQLPALVSALGRRVVLVTGSCPSRTLKKLSGFPGSGNTLLEIPASGEPTTEMATGAAERARRFKPDVVLAVGGGSVIDLGKAVAALVTNTGSLLDHLEVVGKGRPLNARPLPLIAVPTTAGAGSEVTRNAVLTVPGQSVKVSLRSPLMLPEIALVDPELTLDLPPGLTASTGMDALSQLIEPFISCKANPMTDAICRTGIPLAAQALPRAFSNGNDLAAREAMSLASLLGGMALANAGLGAVHGFAGPIGGMFTAPHGAICARLLGPVFRENAHAAGPEMLARFQEISRLITGDHQATPDLAADWLDALCIQLRIPTLGKFGVLPEHIPELVEKAGNSSSMKGNPSPLTPETLTRILRAAL